MQISACQLFVPRDNVWIKTLMHAVRLGINNGLSEPGLQSKKKLSQIW